jgi:hypothetical protein
MIFAASELWGVVKMFRCFTGKWDLAAGGSLLGSAIGLTVLIGIASVLFFAMHARWVDLSATQNPQNKNSP